MLKELTCIMCPKGCDITAVFSDEINSREIIRISGNGCPRGAEYAAQEIKNPMRNIATSILVEGGELPLASVRLTKPIPRGKVFEVMEEIKKVKVSAPIREGEIVIPNVLGLGSDVIVTKTVEKESL